MTSSLVVDDPIGTVALLDEPKRRQLLDLVTISQGPVGRDEAAAELGISRELAAFHLDRLVESGLLEAVFRRRSSRTGPGAGRTAKLYRRTEREVNVSLPPRHYDRAADLLASAVGRMEPASAAAAVAGVARERGATAGREARRNAGSRPGRRRLRAALVELLRGAGYAPTTDPSTGAVSLRNCPYHVLATDHRDLTCGMNLAWADGVAEALGESGLRPELSPGNGTCCVVFQPARRSSGADT